jgi:molybdopterin synthase sulfur carrier subunit
MCPFLDQQERWGLICSHLPPGYHVEGQSVFMDNDNKTAVTLRLPSTLSAYSGGKSQIILYADTVEEMLAHLQQQYPQIWTCLCTEHGTIRQQVKIFVNNQLIEGTDSLKTPLKPGQEVIVLTASFGI